MQRAPGGVTSTTSTRKSSSALATRSPGSTGRPRRCHVGQVVHRLHAAQVDGDPELEEALPTGGVSSRFVVVTGRNLENSRRHEIDGKDPRVKHGPKAACADG